MLNENIVKITGSASMPDGLEVDTSYQLILNGDCTSKTKKSREDGTFNMIYQLRLKDLLLKDEKGQVQLQSKDSKSLSQQMRQAIYSLGLEYEESMKWLLNNLERILETK